ncbi:hypothetical protein C9J03_02730 [Photobacterium gaetbulicola]|uniref:Putative flagellar protein FlaG protein n=1 Tax=Photobacterium gaetbulicola Gung47 TaxID=658445 RepID=A0A0C5X2I9_9GAMM|nr:flagellar protein FlaG [Photobacterium gaetbulicola]AJR09565.1 putative flagellar protein FlaG protein [Photobacterium gaetbulicola Gung47]PSU14358.1 hypothetical protein C9J03_02730 [Photobacterium gaetbulicola]
MEIPPDSPMRPIPVTTSSNPNDTSSSGRDINTAQKNINLTKQPETSLVSDETANAQGETSRPQPDEAMAEKMAMYFQNVNRELKFEVDNEGGDPIVIIIDKASGEVIRQVPAQELLDINESLAKYPPVSLSQKV